MTSKRLLYSLFCILLAIFSFLFVYLVKLPMDGSSNPTIYNYEAVDWEAMSEDQALMYQGEVQFKIRCSKCHGLRGQGNLSAPALNDDVSIFGHNYAAMLAIVRFGSPSREMKGWDSKLRPEDLIALTLYAHQLSTESNIK